MERFFVKALLKRKWNYSPSDPYSKDKEINANKSAIASIVRGG
jgi:hypothetical protein